MSVIRDRLSRLLGETIPEGRIEETIYRIDERGGISNRQMLDMLIITIEEVEKHEKNDI